MGVDPDLLESEELLPVILKKVSFDSLDDMNKVNLPDGQLARFHNPKYPADYLERLDTVLRQKDEIFALLEKQAEERGTTK